jgi:threonine/homoserine/homoserine lactone efflux protein
MHDLLGPLILFALALCLTPGRNVVLVTATAANFGFRRPLPHIAGITVGFGLGSGPQGSALPDFSRPSRGCTRG